jgi:hypothetical protein
MGSCRFSNKVGTVPGLPFVSGPQFPPPAGKLRVTALSAYWLQTIPKYRAIPWSNCFSFPRQA